LKNLVWRLIAELLKSGRKSDRQLAKELKVSQPTISRTRKKLENEGYIKGYTILPDFPKIGYQILALTFVKIDNTLKTADLKKVRENGRDFMKKNLNIVMLEKGTGMGYDGVIMSYHKDYASFSAFLDELKELDFLDFSKVDSFVVNLLDKRQYRSHTYSTLAEHLLDTLQEEKKN